LTRRKLRKEIEDIQLFFDTNPSLDDRIEFEKNYKFLFFRGINVKKTVRGSAKRLITSATDRAIRALEGSGNLKATAKDNGKRLIVAGTDRAIRAIEGSGNLKATAKDSGKRLIVAGTDRAIRAMEGSSVNRLKKYSRWTGAINKTIRDGIDTSGKAARVYKASTQPSITDILGFGLKKRKAPKRRGGALMPAGIP
jgi:hypothetical protein